MPHPKNEANDHSHNCEEGMYRIYNERLVDIHSNLCFCSKQEHTTIEIQERRLASWYSFCVCFNISEMEKSSV